MAQEAAHSGETPKRADRAMARLRTAHRPWTQAGRPVNLKRHTLWVYGKELDVLEDEIGVVEVRLHQDPD